MNTTTRWIAAVSLMVIATGCAETVESKDVKTDGIWADVEATGQDDGTTELTTALRTGGPNSNTYLDLGPDDELIYHVDGKTKTANEESSAFVDMTTYTTTVSKNKNDMAMRVELKRDHSSSSGSECGGFGDATSTTATLPEKFSIDSPSSGRSFSRSSDAIDVRISNTSGDETVAEISGSCLEEDYTREFDGTSVTFESGTLEKEEADDDEQKIPEKCEATLEVTRTRSGSVDSAFEGGEFDATQVRSLTFQTKP